MNDLRATKKPDCVLLLLFFVFGALLGMLYRERTAEFLQLIPGSTVGCFAAILALDASMTGSLFSWLTFPLITLIFGLVAAAETSEIVTLGLDASPQRLLVLALITPLHFLLSAWSLHTAGKLRRSLCRHRHEGQMYIVSFLLMGMTYLICIGLIYLRLQAKL